MEILGIDIGQINCKSSENVSFPSKITTNSLGLLKKHDSIVIDGQKYYIGEGNYNVGVNKHEKEDFIPLLFSLIAKSTNESIVSIVIGTPIAHKDKNKKDILDIVNANKYKRITYKGQTRDIIIDNCIVYPECGGAFHTLNPVTIANRDLIMVDIGGRTTDIGYFKLNINNERELYKAKTLPNGILNMHSKISSILMDRYNIYKDIDEIEKVLKMGIWSNIDNKPLDLSFQKQIYHEYTLGISKILNLEFDMNSEMLILTGGGALELYSYFKEIYNEGTVGVIKDFLFANAKGFKKVGEILWQEKRQQQ